MRQLTASSTTTRQRRRLDWSKCVGGSPSIGLPCQLSTDPLQFVQRSLDRSSRAPGGAQPSWQFVDTRGVPTCRRSGCLPARKQRFEFFAFASTNNSPRIGSRFAGNYGLGRGLPKTDHSPLARNQATRRPGRAPGAHCGRGAWGSNAAPYRLCSTTWSQRTWIGGTQHGLVVWRMSWFSSSTSNEGLILQISHGCQSSFIGKAPSSHTRFWLRRWGSHLRLLARGARPRAKTSESSGGDHSIVFCDDR